MKPDSKARGVGVFGAGAMGRRHLEAWQRLGVPIAGMYARDLARGSVMAEAFGCPVLDSVAGLLETIEIADVCLPTFLHRSVVEQAARAGCQIVCEKPVALEPADAEAMFACCEAARVRMFVAMVVRFFPAYRAAWNAVRAGTLGAVETITLKRVGAPPPPKGSWFLDTGLSGGMLTDLLIHDVDYATWLAGDVMRMDARVQGQGQLQYAHLTLEHTSGVVSRIEGGWVDAEPGLQAGGEIACSGGTIHIEPNALDPCAEDPYVEQLRHFHETLVGGKPFLVSRRDVLRVVQIMAAARKSARDQCAMTACCNLALG